MPITEAQFCGALAFCNHPSMIEASAVLGQPFNQQGGHWRIRRTNKMALNQA
jgi:hypothetical protein